MAEKLSTAVHLLQEGVGLLVKGVDRCAGSTWRASRQCVSPISGSALTCGFGFREMRGPDSSLSNIFVLGFLIFSWVPHTLLGKNTLAWQIVGTTNKQQLQYWGCNSCSRGLGWSKERFKLLEETLNSLEKPSLFWVDARPGLFLLPGKAECLRKLFLSYHLIIRIHSGLTATKSYKKCSQGNVILILW